MEALIKPKRKIHTKTILIIFTFFFEICNTIFVYVSSETTIDWDSIFTNMDIDKLYYWERNVKMIIGVILIGLSQFISLYLKLKKKLTISNKFFVLFMFTLAYGMLDIESKISYEFLSVNVFQIMWWAITFNVYFIVILLLIIGITFIFLVFCLRNFDNLPKISKTAYKIMKFLTYIFFFILPLINGLLCTYFGSNVYFKLINLAVLSLNIIIVCIS